eukprot:365205-Chlamydomonas_euryale.AAC.6
MTHSANRPFCPGRHPGASWRIPAQNRRSHKRSRPERPAHPRRPTVIIRTFPSLKFTSGVLCVAVCVLAHPWPRPGPGLARALDARAVA